MGTCSLTPFIFLHRCREKQRKEASRLQTVNRKLSAMNKLLMEENDRLQKQVSQLVYENGYMRHQLQSVSFLSLTPSCFYFERLPARLISSTWRMLLVLWTWFCGVLYMFCKNVGAVSVGIFTWIWVITSSRFTKRSPASSNSIHLIWASKFFLLDKMDVPYGKNLWILSLYID